jgi:hypothetical protein
MKLTAARLDVILGIAASVLTIYFLTRELKREDKSK